MLLSRPERHSSGLHPWVPTPIQRVLRGLRWWARCVGQAFRLYGRFKAYHWSATITLFAFMALFPLALFLTILARFLPDPLLLQLLTQWLPDQVARTLVYQLNLIGVPMWIDWALGTVAVLWALSHILHSVIEISDDFYAYSDRPFWRRRLLALGIMVVFTAWQLLTLMFYAVSGWVLKGFQRLPLLAGAGLNSHLDSIGRLVSWTSVLILHWVSLILLYGMAAPRFRWREQVPGATFTTLAWWLASKVLTLYVRWVPIQTIYGALTSILVFILWVYWAATLMIVGIGVNALGVRATVEAPSGRPRQWATQDGEL
ncbi:MAG: YihY/virulence factor BrkB family protein [Acidobacteria bacterium]|nr:YihY/virulence factor BrkB family protein [Acidobacteriota bacterium]MDW7984883.1 YhjD/YihY/BrkB family envelope integrity protein [Acidobacteriota bacterium]